MREIKFSKSEWLVFNEIYKGFLSPEKVRQNSILSYQTILRAFYKLKQLGVIELDKTIGQTNREKLYKITKKGKLIFNKYNERTLNSVGVL